MRQLLALLFPLLFTPLLHAQSPTHGTINILLANSNGMVLVTDSRASNHGRVVNDASHKMFQIDSVTVCSIAGFGTDQGPQGRTAETAGGEITSLIEGLQKQGSVLSFRDKVTVFTGALGARLVGLETEYEYAEKSNPPHEPTQLFMLFAGFDSDAGAQIAKATISLTSTELVNSHREFRSEVEIKVKPVGKDFLYLTAGVDDLAQDRLQGPTAFENEPGLNEYRQAFRGGQTAKLKVDQLEELARYLEKETSDFVGVVGGPIQLATLSNNHVQMTLPPNLIVDPSPYATGFVFYNRIEDSPFVLMIRNTPHTVFVNNSCRNAAFVLDDQTFIGGQYLNCYFYFNGGDFYRDPSVEITGGKLILGPHVEANSYFLDKARRSMPELAPIPYTDLPNAEAVRKQFWPAD
jgi:hypothetical protein